MLEQIFHQGLSGFLRFKVSSGVLQESEDVKGVPDFWKKIPFMTKNVRKKTLHRKRFKFDVE